MAEAIFNALAQDKGLGLEAESAGVAAVEGDPMDPNAAAALEEIGIYDEGHRARQVTREMVEAADLVLAMTPQHVAQLRQDFGTSFDLYTLLEYASGASSEEGIPDPRGGPMTTYRASARQLLEHLDRLADRLADQGSWSKTAGS